MDWKTLVEKNMGLYMSFLKSYSTPKCFHTEEEYKQEILISFYRAAKKFDPTKGCLFSTFAFKIMLNARRTFYRTLLNKTKIMNKKMHSLDLYLELKDRKNIGVCKELVVEEPDEGDMVPVVNTFRNYIKKASPKIRFIFDKRAEGVSFEEIAKALGCSKQNVHVIMARHMKLMRKYLRSD